MRIDPKKCVACGNCTYVCPMGAIYIDPVIERATVNRDECVECYSCYNGLSQEHLNPTMVRTVRKIFKMMRVRFDPEPDVCPTAAFAPEELMWPRVVRRASPTPSASRIDRHRRPRHRRSEDQRREWSRKWAKSDSPLNSAGPVWACGSATSRRWPGNWRAPAWRSRKGIRS